MGIKSNRTIASYFNRFGATGLDAVTPAPPPPVYTEATGGFISDYTDSGTHYRAHIFTSSGAFVVSQVGDGTPTGGPSDVDTLVVAGGAGGAGAQNGGGGGGGGGAGGFRTKTGIPVSVSSYTVTIGGGGAAGDFNFPGGAASNSVFNPSGSENTTKITSSAGGAGAKAGNGADGGAGGGAA